MAIKLSIIIPTRNRARMVQTLLSSVRELVGLEQFQPQIIVGDNNSQDDTWRLLHSLAESFPLSLTLLKVQKPGKSAVMNEASQAARGDVLAFLDDDVVVQPNWLCAVEQFFQEKEHQAAQGVIRIRPPHAENLEIHTLINRYRTIPSIDFGPDIKHFHSLNGANFAVSRLALNRVGPFDERLGPGASGTSEDVDFARRLRRKGFRIGYMGEAVVYHSVDPIRLTEDYFRTHHKRQGHSRVLMNDKGIGRIFLDLGRATAQFAFYSLGKSERDRYRSKGRIYHYLGMLETKLKNRNSP
ncbi:MAG TPA: glycosyltransferase family A protein [Candidatus Binatia bacterium]|nr:glycosyltransferase family A protein [Candidatus Binatia bacterium]